MGSKGTTTSAEIPAELKNLFTGTDDHTRGVAGANAQLMKYFTNNLFNWKRDAGGFDQGPDSFLPRPVLEQTDGDGGGGATSILSSADTSGQTQGGNVRRHLGSPSTGVNSGQASFMDGVFGGPTYDASYEGMTEAGMDPNFYDVRNVLSESPDYVAGLNENQDYVGTALRGTLSQYYDMSPDGTMTEKAFDENHPLFSNARSLFDKTTKQAVGNRAALSGLGNSNAVTNDLATAWGEQFTPLYTLLNQNKQADKQFATTGLSEYGAAAQANKQKMLDSYNTEKTRQRTLFDNMTTGMLGGFVPSTIGSKTTGGGMFK